MKLDAVTTIAVGELDRNGVPLSVPSWRSLCTDIRLICQTLGTLVAEAQGCGATSDQDDTYDEATAVFIVINVADLPTLRRAIATRLHAYDLTSACFATDAAHEPVFNTTDGSRPSGPPCPISDRPAHKGHSESSAR